MFARADGPCVLPVPVSSGEPADGTGSGGSGYQLCGRPVRRQGLPGQPARHPLTAHAQIQLDVDSPATAATSRCIAVQHLPVHNVSVEDGLLFMDIRQAAAALARRHDGLDYSVQSLDALDAALASAGDARPATRDAGAYLGEVLIRHGGFA